MPPCGGMEELMVCSMWIPCLARVSYGPSVSGFQGWQGRRRDSPMRQRKLIGAPSTRPICEGKNHHPPNNTRTSYTPFHNCSLRQACFTPVGASLTVLWTALVEARFQPTFLRPVSQHDSTWSRMIIATSRIPLIWRPSGRAVELEAIRPSRRLEAKGGFC